MAGTHQAAMSTALGPVTKLSNQSISDVTPGSPSLVAYTLTLAGLVQQFQQTGGTTTLENWINPAAGVGNYTIRAHQNSGTAVGGSALDTDLALSSTRSWTLTEAVVGTLTAQLLCTLKYLGTTIATVTINLSSQRT